jgi:hypothetical protein
MQKYRFSSGFQAANHVLYMFSRPNLLRWLAGWLAGWLGGWLAGWLADWLAGWLACWL